MSNPTPTLTPAQLQRARSHSSATIHEAAGQTGALPSAIKPLTPDMRVCGPAVTVDCPPYDNLWIHRALYIDTAPGAVLVVSVNNAHEAGYFGEILAHAATARGITGLVIDGCVRDGALLTKLGFPVFARGLCIQGTNKSPTTGGLNHPLTIGNTTIQPGDLVLGDNDGIVIINPNQLPHTLNNADTRTQKEDHIITALHHGANTLDLYNLNT